MPEAQTPRQLIEQHLLMTVPDISIFDTPYAIGPFEWIGIEHKTQGRFAVAYRAKMNLEKVTPTMLGNYTELVKEKLLHYQAAETLLEKTET